MLNRYLKILLSVMAIATMSTLRANAQFYDSDDEVRFYVHEYCLSNPGSAPNALIFNFNGSKSGMINTHSRTYTLILEDEYFFEKEIYRDQNKKVLNFLNSSDGKTRYGYYSQTGRVNKWVFSNDGSNLEEVSAGNREGYNGNRRFRRVSKEKFIDIVLKYANNSSRSGTWR